MKRILSLLFTFALLTLFGAKISVAETGKCIVTDVAGNKMVIECNQQSKGFDKGAQIKIKTDKKKPEGKG
jgi:hypothetical protein